MTPAKLFNRAELEAALTALEPKETLSIAALDLDNFQEINQTFGHVSGDSVLRNLERTLVGSVPLEALVARIGGDE